MNRMLWLALILWMGVGVSLGIFINPSLAAEGQAVFESLRCGSCHKPDVKTTGVSLAEIAKAYSADQNRLVAFFNGESKPLIETDKAGMMRGQVKKLSNLPDEDKKSLAAYILSFK